MRVVEGRKSAPLTAVEAEAEDVVVEEDEEGSEESAIMSELSGQEGRSEDVERYEESSFVQYIDTSNAAPTDLVRFVVPQPCGSIDSWARLSSYDLF